MAFLVFVLAFVSLALPWRESLPGYHYSFPRDHFDHPDFRTEWWYYTGNLNDADGHRYGFELVFFRQGERRGQPANPSAWRVDDLYLAHLALTDIDGKHFYYSERLNRRGPGIAGADFPTRRIWNGNWKTEWDQDRQTLSAIAEEFRFELKLVPMKPPVIHGLAGVSQKAEGAGRASHYVSFPRMSVTGFVEIGTKHSAVTGLAWMDHEWFTHQLDTRQVGWDWFSVQLENKTELMLFELRRKDGTIDPFSSGTFIDAQGHAHHLTSAEFTLHPLEYWISPKTKTRYPVRWKISVPVLQLSLECSTTVREQELDNGKGKTSYWEGAVVYDGTVKGVGYLEMTGYGKPVRIE